MKITKQFLTITLSLTLGNYLAAQDSGFKPSGNLYGYMFGDYANKSHNDTLQRGGGNVQYRGTNSLSSGNILSTSNNEAANTQTNAFQIRRVYLGYDYKFAPNLTATVLLAHEQNLDAGGNNTMYLKYANVKWSNIFKNTDLVIGQYGTCSFASPFGTEPLWGYRSVERTIMDLHNTDASSDLGVSLQGKLWSQQVPDSTQPTFIGYMLQVGNGSSAKPETDNGKKFRGNLYVALLHQKLVLGLYGDYVVGQYSPYVTSNTTMKAYASYRIKSFHIGFEVFNQTNKNSDIYKVYDASTKKLSVNDTSSGAQLGISVFASAGIIKHKLNVFARYDMYNPDTKWNTNNVYSGVSSAIKGSTVIDGSALTASTFYTQSFITAGLDWTPNQRFHIMPNIWYNGYKSMMSSSGPAGTGSDFSARVKSDADITYRVTFYFIFNQGKSVSNNGYY